MRCVRSVPYFQPKPQNGPEDWKTPLIRMIEKGKIGAVRALVQHGADVTLRHPHGRTPRQLAVDLGLLEVVPLLHGED